MTDGGQAMLKPPPGALSLGAAGLGQGQLRDQLRGGWAMLQGPYPQGYPVVSAARVLKVKCLFSEYVVNVRVNSWWKPLHANRGWISTS